MLSAILSRTDLLVLPLVSVVLFFAIFLLTLAWIFRPGARAIYAERSRLVFGTDRPSGSPAPADGARDLSGEAS